MKTVIMASFVALALGTATGCMSRMHGRMMQGMMSSQTSSGEATGAASDNMMSMDRKGMMSSMMDCCNEQCPMMKGKHSKSQPS
jgi:hypothetical protein